MGLISDYKEGKIRVQLWAGHWMEVAEANDLGTTVESTLMDYGVAIRQSFNVGVVPDILIMSPRTRETHRIIYELDPPDEYPEKREAIITWHFADEEERKRAFGSASREPKEMKLIYEMVARRARGARKRHNGPVSA